MEFRQKNIGGFTLVELLIVIVAFGILAVVAAPQLSNLPVTKAQFAVHQMQSDVRYAQLLAIQTQKRTRVVFNGGGNSYELQIETSPSSWVAVANPSTKANYDVLFNSGAYQGVAITTTSLNSGSSVIFDSYGAPFNASEASLSEPAFVELNSKYQLRFRAETGKVDIVTL